MTNPGRPCVFCGSRPVTREHIFPAWIGEVLGHLTPEFKAARTREIPGRKPETVSWTTKKFNATVKRFCRACNNNWMSQIEIEAQPILKPMILGETHTTILSPREQIVLSRWAYKTALVAEFAFPDASIVPPEEYRNFHRFKLPPENGAVIWTTAYGGLDKGAHCYRRNLVALGVRRSPYGDMPETSKTDGFLTTITLHRAILQVLGYFRGKWKPSRDGGIQTLKFLTRIWPPTGAAVIWPKDGFALATDSFKAFTTRSDFFD